MRVAILAAGWTGFNEASCRELAARGVELLVVAPASNANIAFQTTTISGYAEEFRYQGEPDRRAIAERVAQFGPDALLVHSWHVPAYRHVLRTIGARTLRVLWMDNVWRNVPKQWLGRAVAPVWVQPLFDCVMVPSDRSEFFARRLGFGEDEVIRGSLSADTSLFTSGPRSADELASRRRFIACLRLVHHKGADVLAEAYGRYRTLVDEPWELQVAGLGPMADRFTGVPGVDMLGFVQPAELAEAMRAASCLVVPSRIDPFGVILHEGVLCGLPVITTYQVGAAPAYAQDGQNGWIVASGEPDSLARTMARMSQLEPDRLASMSEVSRALGARTSASGWARHIHEQLDWRLADLRRA